MARKGVSIPFINTHGMLEALSLFDTAAAEMVEAQAQISKAIEKVLRLVDLDVVDGPILPERLTFQVGYDDGPPKTLGLVLPEFPPRLEVHWKKLPNRENYRAVRDRWFSLIETALEAAEEYGVPLPRDPFKRGTLWVTTFYGKALARDPDNYTAKFIIDALRRNRIIEDDDYSRIQIVLRGSAKGPARTEVLVEEASDQLDGLIARARESVKSVRFVWNERCRRYVPSDQDYPELG